MTNMLRAAGIVGLGTCLPEKIVTNDDMAKFVDTSHEWIVTRTGISERRFATEEESASDIGAKAAIRAIADAGIAPGDIDLIIVPTLTPDMVFPATASLIQHNIGAKNAAAFDLSAGCTGFLYALSVANQFVASGMYNTVLVVAAETLSKILNFEDRTTCVLFGDGAGAAVIRPVPEGQGFLAFELGSDGSGADLLKVPAGGSRKPASAETIQNKEHYIHMAGSDVFKFAVRVMGDSAVRVLEKAGLTKEDVDFLVPHQANTRIIESATKRLGLPADKVVMNLNRYGNMSSASIPVALEECVINGKIKQGDLIVLVGFGAGLTWGSCVVRWTK